MQSEDNLLNDISKAAIILPPDPHSPLMGEALLSYMLQHPGSVPELNVHCHKTLLKIRTFVK
jgi:hypothetical protein